MGYNLELHFVKIIDNPKSHEFNFESPQTNWDYVDMSDEFPLYLFGDYEVRERIEEEIEKSSMSKKVIAFMQKTDGRIYAGDEGFEPTIFPPSDIQRFIQLFEQFVADKKIPEGLLQKYRTVNKRGEIPYELELQGIKDRIGVAKEKGYFFKCLDR